MSTKGQFFQITADSLEEYYPIAWRKKSDEVKKMSGDEKLELARLVGDNIEKQDFEKEMLFFKVALDKCWLNCFE